MDKLDIINQVKEKLAIDENDDFTGYDYETVHEFIFKAVTDTLAENGEDEDIENFHQNAQDITLEIMSQINLDENQEKGIGYESDEPKSSDQSLAESIKEIDSVLNSDLDYISDINLLDKPKLFEDIEQKDENEDEFLKMSVEDAIKKYL